MVISSRTPEGTPNRCPVCGNDLRLEPSWPNLDGPCPSCGHLLWFQRANVRGDERVERAFQEVGRRAVMEILEEKFGTVPSEIRRLIDSIREPERLKAMLRLAVRCASWEELVAEPH